MGNLSTILAGSADLASRYAIGEIVDIAGQGGYYDATTSKWMQSNTWVAASALTVAVKSALAALGSAYRTATAHGALLASLENISPSFFGPGTIGGVKVVQAQSDSAGLVAQSLVFDATGVSSAPTGLVSALSPSTYGLTHAITDNGTYFYDYSYSNATTLSCARSTDGKTWSAQSLSGLPTFGSSASAGFYTGAAGTNPATTSGYSVSSAGGVLLAVWCGARMLVLGQQSGAAYWSASLSTDGLTFGGEQSASVLGSATIGWANSHYLFFWRNGNNVVISLPTANVYRYSADGGVTWGVVTNGASALASGAWVQPNATTAAKLFSIYSSSATAYQSANSGQSWTARTLPVAPSAPGASIAYSGSTLIYVPNTSSGTLYKSTDDGATWAAVSMPAGATGLPRAAFHDGTRFIVVLSSAQMLTSTDATTWTIRTLPEVPSTNLLRCAALDSSRTLITDSSNKVWYTADGGVTWSCLAADTTTRYPSGPLLAISTAGFSGFLCGGGFTAQTNTDRHFLVADADLQAGGAYYRATTATITPLRTNAVSYVRVA